MSSTHFEVLVFVDLVHGLHNATFYDLRRLRYKNVAINSPKYYLSLGEFLSPELCDRIVLQANSMFSKTIQ